MSAVAMVQRQHVIEMAERNQDVPEVPGPPVREVDELSDDGRFVVILNSWRAHARLINARTWGK